MSASQRRPKAPSVKVLSMPPGPGVHTNGLMLSWNVQNIASAFNPNRNDAVPRSTSNFRLACDARETRRLSNT